MGVTLPQHRPHQTAGNINTRMLDRIIFYIEEQGYSDEEIAREMGCTVRIIQKYKSYIPTKEG